MDTKDQKAIERNDGMQAIRLFLLLVILAAFYFGYELMKRSILATAPSPEIPGVNETRINFSVVFMAVIGLVILLWLGSVFTSALRITSRQNKRMQRGEAVRLDPIIPVNYSRAPAIRVEKIKGNKVVLVDQAAEEKRKKEIEEFIENRKMQKAITEAERYKREREVRKKRRWQAIQQMEQGAEKRQALRDFNRDFFND